MDERTDTRKPGDEHRTSDDLPAGAPPALRTAADAGMAGADEAPLAGPTPDRDRPVAEQRAEASALDFVLGAPRPLKYDVPVTVDVPGGRSAEMVFVVRQVDGSRILELEDEHTQGIGPFAKLDDARFNAALVSEACIEMQEKNSNGQVVRRVTADSPEFVGQFGSPAIAMEKRFGFQAGVLSGIAGQIRSVSGWRPDRVGQAERPIREAVGNSSGGAG